MLAKNEQAFELFGTLTKLMLDIRNWGGREYSKNEANQFIAHGKSHPNNCECLDTKLHLVCRRGGAVG